MVQNCVIYLFKWTVSQDFLALGFFHESPSPKPPENNIRGHFDFFRKLAEISASQCAPPVSTHGKFATGTANVAHKAKFPGINDTVGKFATGLEKSSTVSKEAMEKGLLDLK
jgi:hypothetical protein